MKSGEKSTKEHLLLTIRLWKKNLMKMFNLINIGERAGSGVPDIFKTWEQEGWVEPIIEACQERWIDLWKDCRTKN